METRQIYLTRTQVAVLFGVSPHTVTRWAKKRCLPSILMPGGQRRYVQADMERLFKQLRRVEV